MPLLTAYGSKFEFALKRDSIISVFTRDPKAQGYCARTLGVTFKRRVL